MNFVRGTLLHVFASAGWKDLAELWIEAGGSATAVDGTGVTPSVVAARRGHFDFPGAKDAAAKVGLTTEPYGYFTTKIMILYRSSIEKP